MNITIPHVWCSVCGAKARLDPYMADPRVNPLGISASCACEAPLDIEHPVTLPDGSEQSSVGRLHGTPPMFLVTCKAAAGDTVPCVLLGGTLVRRITLAEPHHPADAVHLSGRPYRYVSKHAHRPPPEC